MCGQNLKLSPGRTRYMDKRGKGMWDKVMSLLERLDTPAPGSHEREPNLLNNDAVAPTFSPVRTSFGLWG